MLIPCVECGKKCYTDESPLWFHCDSCLHPKETKKYKCVICLEEYKLSETNFVNYCSKCAKIFQEKRHLLSQKVYCRVCQSPMEYFQLAGEYDWLQCSVCDYEQSAY